ncbi:MAG: hypothetical protein IT385_06110 [Deltaproteobacteria bacterium]|nr:hypothetical protein [Deltaproteobacteria bacterium]
MRAILCALVLVAAAPARAEQDGDGLGEEAEDPWLSSWSERLDDPDGAASTSWRGLDARRVERVDARTAERLRAAFPVRPIGPSAWAFVQCEDGCTPTGVILVRDRGACTLVWLASGVEVLLDEPRPESPIGRALAALVAGRPAAIPGAAACASLRAGASCALVDVPRDDLDAARARVVWGLRRALGAGWVVLDHATEDETPGTLELRPAPWHPRRGAPTLRLAARCAEGCTLTLAVGRGR